MIKLIDYKDKFIGRGKIFRLKAEYPYEDTVDLMLFEVRDPSTRSDLGLIAITGNKAGLIYTYLPEEATENTALLSEWVRNNWYDKIYPWCPLEEVFICDKYKPPKIPVK